MENRHTEEYDSIELLSIIKWLIGGMWLIIAFTIIAAAGMYAYKKHTYIPMYTATASMVVNAKPMAVNMQNGYIQVSASDITLAKNLVPTYTSIMKSNRVMDYVRQDLKVDLPLSEIRSYIKLESVKDTQVLNLSVTCPVPVMAMEIANSIMRVAPQAMMETVEVGSINVLDYATFPTRANPSDTVKTTAMAALAGMVLGCGIVVASNMFVFKINSPRDIETRFAMNVLEEIPHVKRPARKRKRLLVTHKVKNDHLFVESYSRLTTVFQHICEREHRKKIMITSSIPHEGKTTAAINLALGLVQNGNRVLLIDTDHHHPSVHTYLSAKKPRGKKGDIATLNTNPAEGDILALPNGLEIMIYANSKRKFQKAADFRLLMEELQQEYDHIIFDTPPIGILSDPLRLSRIVDGAIVIVKQHACSKKDLEKAMHYLEKVEISVLGCVMNDIRSWGNRKYYYGKYKKYYQKQAS